MAEPWVPQPGEYIVDKKTGAVGKVSEHPPAHVNVHWFEYTAPSGGTTRAYSELARRDSPHTARRISMTQTEQMAKVREQLVSAVSGLKAGIAVAEAAHVISKRLGDIPTERLEWVDVTLVA